MYVCLSAFPSVRPYVCLSVRLSVRPSVCLSICLKFRILIPLGPTTLTIMTYSSGNKDTGPVVVLSYFVLVGAHIPSKNAVL